MLEAGGGGDEEDGFGGTGTAGNVVVAGAVAAVLEAGDGACAGLGGTGAGIAVDELEGLVGVELVVVCSDISCLRLVSNDLSKSCSGLSTYAIDAWSECVHG